MLSAWPQLAATIDVRIEELQLRRQLEQAALDWVRQRREPSMLWRGEQLRQARAALGPGTAEPEREFLDASRFGEAKTSMTWRSSTSCGHRFLCHRLDQPRHDLQMLRSQRDRDPLTPPVTAVEPNLTGRSRSSERGRTSPNGAQRAQNSGADHDPISRGRTPCSRFAPEAGTTPLKAIKW
jgi:hypothetical protein